MLIDIFDLMSTEEINYILNYFNHLVSLPERIAISHHAQAPHINWEVEGGRTEWLLKRQLITQDPEILKLLDGGIEQLRMRAAENVMKNHAGEVFFNKCKICGKLARTHLAKQCRFCGHDWH